MTQLDLPIPGGLNGKPFESLLRTGFSQVPYPPHGEGGIAWHPPTSVRLLAGAELRQNRQQPEKVHCRVARTVSFHSLDSNTENQPSFLNH